MRWNRRKMLGVGLLLGLLLFACDDLTWRAKPAPACEADQTGCDGTWKTMCREGEWVAITDCSDLDKICVGGACVRPADGDAELDAEPDSDGDAADEAELEETGDGDAADQAELEESGDEDTTDQAELEESGDEDATDEAELEETSDGDAADQAELEETSDGDGELETDPDTETIPELDPDPESEPESDEEAPPAFSCAEGICTDPATGFEWQETPTGGTMTWDDAITHCRNLDLGGTGWRLPNISELRTIVRNCADIETGGICGVKDVCSPCGVSSGEVCLASSCYSASCDPTCTDNDGQIACFWQEELHGTCSVFWSSSRYEDDGSHAWYVDFNVGGGVYYYDKSVNYGFARCVRDTTPGFVRIPAGSFTMGSPSGEAGRDTNETQHSVTLTYNFEMQTKEVTQAEFTAFAGTNPSWFGPNADGADCGTNCPVERVDWYEAVAYANWLSGQKGLTPCYVLTSCTGTLGGGCGASTSYCSSGTYACTVALNGVSKPQDCTGFRLPTEAEWEYAIRAGSTTAFYNGGITYTDCTVDANLNAIGWYCGNASSTTHPGGQKSANAWGLYDMSGNVREWAWDRYQEAYETDVETNPVGPGSGSYRVGRGGYWGNIAQSCRSAVRYHGSPDDRGNDIGFRLVRSLP